ncbi:hypothetical protein V5799_004827 [Amblyomma americanum]|uniref:Uncharacterized protein n=1 Tax=Amblyomma americanum TaxID=6943 RepID=A0AAQ4D501_AMBAM
MEAQSPDVCAGSSAFGRSPATRPSTPRLERNKVAGAVAGVACSLSLVVATCVLLWMLLTPQSGMHRVNTDAPFCCPEEAAQLFAVISRSVSPCRDFFAYVCYNAIKQGFIQEGVTRDMLNKIKGDLIRGSDRFESPAAAALHGFYTSCMNEIWQRDRRLREVASVFLDEVNASRAMGHAELLRFALSTQHRYRLNFFFTIYFHRSFTLYERTYLRSDNYDNFCDDCFPAALSAVNARLRTNCTRGDFFALKQMLPGVDEDNETHGLAVEEILNALGRTNASWLEATMREFFPTFDLSTPTYAISKESLLDEIRILWNVSNQPLSLVYMLTTVVIEAMSHIQVDRELDAPTPRTWRICDDHGYGYDELWHTTYVAALTSAAKDRRMRAIFEATREAAANYALLRRIVAAGNQTAHFDALLGNMTLLLPGDLVLGHVVVPDMPPRGFVRNYFRALRFEFEVKLEKLRRGMPIYHQHDDEPNYRTQRFNETSLYVPPTAYSTLGASTSNSLLADAPVIASDIGTLIWSGVMLHKHWNSHTLAAIESYSQCVLESLTDYMSKSDDLLESTVALPIAARVAASGGVGISSTSPTATDWLDMRIIWSLYRMSKAQFFYARYAYFRCSADGDSMFLVNEVLSRSADFGAAFQCNAQDLVNITACADVTQ